MSSRELSEWMAFSSIEPFGEVREDYRAGLICSVIANASGNYKKHLKPDDFISLFSQVPAEKGKSLMHEQIAIMMGSARG